jgi:hypothetical protein
VAVDNQLYSGSPSYKNIKTVEPSSPNYYSQETIIEEMKNIDSGGWALLYRERDEQVTFKEDADLEVKGKGVTLRKKKG